MRTGEVIADREAVMATGEAVYTKYFGEVNEETKPIFETVGAKRHVVRIHIDRIVSWDHRKLGGQY